MTGLPAALALDAGEVEPAKATLATWLAWFKTLVYEGDEANPSWQRNRMEYAFALKAGDLALQADEYTDGHVDWDDFRVAALAPNAQPFDRCSPSPRVIPRRSSIPACPRSATGSSRTAT